LNLPLVRSFRLFAELDPDLGWLGLVRVINALGFALAMPFLGIYLHEEIGVSMIQIGLMLTAAGIVGSTASTVGGALSDITGRKRLVVYLMSARGLSFLLLAWLVWSRQPFGVFAAVFIISAVLGNPIFAITDAMVADVVAPERRNEAFGAMRVAVNLGWALGPALGGLLVASGYYLLFLATAATIGLSAVLIALKVRETAPNSSRNRKSGLELGAVMKDHRLLYFLAAAQILFLVQGQLVTPISVHASSNVGLSKSQVGSVYFLNGAMVVLLQLFVTRLVKRYHPLSALAAAGIIYAFGYWAVGLAGNYAGMLGATVLITFGEMVGAPTATAYVSMLAPEGKMGAYMGVFGLVVHLGWTVGPLMGGVLMDTMTNPLHVWGAIAMVAVISAVAFIGLKIKTPPPRVGTASKD
jgi:MFS family permease